MRAKKVEFTREQWEQWAQGKQYIDVSLPCLMQLANIFICNQNRLIEADIITTRALFSQGWLIKKYLLWIVAGKDIYQLPGWKVDDLHVSETSTFDDFYTRVIQSHAQEILEETGYIVTIVTSAKILANFTHTSSQTWKKKTYATIVLEGSIDPNIQYETDGELEHLAWLTKKELWQEGVKIQASSAQALCIKTPWEKAPWEKN